MTQRQIPFELSPAPSFARDDFLVTAANEAVWRFIDSWPAWPDTIVTLVGPGGSGKSHLAAIWAARTGARIMPAVDIDADRLDRLLAKGSVVVEDADRNCGSEDELFHLLNKARLEGAYILLTARSAPDGWRLGARDLLSRLRQAPIIRLGSPDDELMRAVLVKLFMDRQLLIEAPLIDYVALRLDRSLDCARSFVDALDREALARGKRVTKPLAAQVMATLEASRRGVPD